MIIDLPQNIITIATQQAQAKGMATREYIVNLIEQDIDASSVTTLSTHADKQASGYYYDIERMDEALKAPRVEVPQSALKDLVAFEKWLDEAFE